MYKEGVIATKRPLESSGHGESTHDNSWCGLGVCVCVVYFGDSNTRFIFHCTIINYIKFKINCTKIASVGNNFNAVSAISNWLLMIRYYAPNT